MAISGYWANLLVCTPAQRRIDVKIHDHHAIEFIRAEDTFKSERGQPDDKLKKILSTLDSGILRIGTKSDAARAMQTRKLGSYAWVLYNTTWLVVKNETDIDFLTSDNPVAFEDPGPRGRVGLPRYLPITPKLCLYCEMLPHKRYEAQPDFSQSPEGVIRVGEATRAYVRRVNKAIVQCAESLVISPSKLPSIEALGRKYAKYLPRR